VLQAPGGPISWARDPTGATYLVIGFRPDLHDHPMLHQGMAGVIGFLRAPNVKGVAALAEWDESRCLFAYAARDGVLVSAIHGRLVEQRKSAGPRAALELLAVAGPILDEAARAGRRHGLPGHGALQPWRILVHPLGGLTIVGHGLPAVEVNAWLDEETGESPGSTLAYFPPERIREEDEDVRGDLYALAVCALELLVGRSVFDGPPDQVLEQISAGRPAAAAANLETPELVSLFQRALAPAPSARFPTGRAQADQAQALLRAATGVSLFDLAAAAAEAVGDDTLDEDTSVSYLVRGAGPATDDLATAIAVEQPLPSDLLPMPLPSRVPQREPSEVRVDDDATLVNLHRPQGPLPREAPPTRPPPSRPPSVAPAPFTVWSPPSGEVDRTDVIGVPIELIESMTASDAHAAPPPIPDPGPDPSLAAIQNLARRIVDRTSDLAARAMSLSARIQERAASDAAHRSLARTAQTGADRARRSADAARNAANLLALDEDASGALITLDLVRNAELQCEGALGEVLAQHKELERYAERVQAQARALHDAARRATEHAHRATDAANQADDLVTVLEQEQQEGLLTATGTTEAVDLAIASAERAHASAEEARAQSEQSTRSDRADLALRYAEQARRAEESALDALRETREAAERARRLETATREAAARSATDGAARARTASEDAWRALQRTEEALRLAASNDSRRARDECAGLVRDAEAAAAEAERAQQSLRGLEKASDFDRVASQIDRAAGRAETAAIQAAATSDRIVRAAGVLAESRARLSKLQEEGRGLTERSRAAVQRAREEADALLDAMSRLPSEVLATERKELAQHLTAASELLPTMDARAADVLAGQDAGTVESTLSALRRLGDSVSSRLTAAEALAQSMRTQADDELREQERREEARREVVRSANLARESARKCRDLVNKAAALAASIPPPLPGCKELEEVTRMRARAVEIIDIAEFQAGEALASADAAGRERDPAEARGHAQTATSFLDRIAADVPEAVSLLQDADKAARRENDALLQARSRAGECESLVQQLLKESHAAVASAITETSDWRGHPLVAGPIDQAQAQLVGFDEDQNESTWARDHTGRARSSTEVHDYLPRAESALARARERRKRVEQAIDGIRRGVAAAEASAAAVAEARKSARSALDRCTADLGRVVAAQQRLREVVARHGAGGNDLESANAELGLRELANRVRTLRQELEALADKAEVTTDPDQANRMAGAALERKAESELAVERAAEMEARGIAAAEQVARARAEAEKRRLTAAREAATDHARRAKEAVERIDHALDEAEDEESKTSSPDARNRFLEAEQLGETLRTQVAEVERLGDEVRGLEGLDAVLQVADRLARLCDTVVAEAARTLTVIQEALDLSRAAEAEATALRSVRDEVRAMVAAADEAAERAAKDATRLRHLLAQSPRADVRTMQEQSVSVLQTANGGAAKVRAALPLAEQASSLPIAEATLRAARQALDRTVGAAEQLRQLTVRGNELLAKEKEALAAAVGEARAKAAQPAQEAVAAANKASTWSEAGRREWEEAGRPASLEGLVRVLERSVSDVRQKAAVSQEAARRTADAPTEETARSLGRDVRQAADVTNEAARHARAALDELREQLQSLRAEGAAIQGMAQEAAEHATAAAQVADQAEVTLRELEAAVDALAMPSEAVESSLLTVRTCATNARFAAATASSLSDGVRAARRRADAEQAVEDAHRALEDALDALERVVAAESTCRAAIEAHQLRRRQEVERADQERRRREQEAVAARAEQERRRLEEEEDERRRRDEERRARVDRRREDRERNTGPVQIERRPSSQPPAPASSAFSRSRPATPPPSSTTPAPAADRESLRSMLRNSRPAASPPADAPARPRRRGDPRRDLPDLSGGDTDPDAATMVGGDEQLSSSFRKNPDHEPTEDRPEGSTTGRNVRSWSPAGGRATGDSTAARPRPRPERSVPHARPAGLNAPVADDMTEPGGSSGDKVDALLERLRARRSDRD
jgi:hypothetical protein